MSPLNHRSDAGFILLDAVCGASVACIFALGLSAMVSVTQRAFHERTSAENALRLASSVLNSFSVDNGLEQAGTTSDPNWGWHATATVESPPGMQHHGIISVVVSVSDISGSVLAHVEGKRLVGHGA